MHLLQAIRDHGYYYRLEQQTAVNRLFVHFKIHHYAQC